MGPEQRMGDAGLLVVMNVVDSGNALLRSRCFLFVLCAGRD